MRHYSLNPSQYAHQIVLPNIKHTIEKKGIWRESEQRVTYTTIHSHTPLVDALPACGQGWYRASWHPAEGWVCPWSPRKAHHHSRQVPQHVPCGHLGCTLAYYWPHPTPAHTLYVCPLPPGFPAYPQNTYISKMGKSIHQLFAGDATCLHQHSACSHYHLVDIHWSDPTQKYADRQWIRESYPKYLQ